MTEPPAPLESAPSSCHPPPHLSPLYLPSSHNSTSPHKPPNFLRSLFLFHCLPDSACYFPLPLSLIFFFTCFQLFPTDCCMPLSPPLTASSYCETRDLGRMQAPKESKTYVKGLHKSVWTIFSIKRGLFLMRRFAGRQGQATFLPSSIPRSGVSVL